MGYKKKTKILLFTAWIFSCAVFGYFAPTIPVVRDLFSIKKVNVIGTDKFTKQDIENIFSKENWFFLNTDRIKKELKKYNFVEDVKIDRYFVGNINLTVLERKPFAYLIHKDKKIMIDENGTVLDEKFFPKKKYKNLPVIIYNDVSIKNDKFSKVKKIYETLKSLKVKKYLISKSQISCILDNGKILVFNIFDLEEGLEKAKIFINKVSLDNFRYIDFSFDSMVVTRR